MTFTEAVKKCLSNYFKFSGRAGRSEFWWFYLFTFLVQIVSGIIDGALSGNYYEDGYVQALASLAFCIPSVAVGSRRLHDRNLSGWWQLIVIVPILGLILLIVWWALAGEDTENRFGPSPTFGEGQQRRASALP
jgi:uncharacterized membrane protein YhaH (DUF805 family)